MIGRKKKKQQPVGRSPQINRQKQTAFHYSSNRSANERPLQRNENPTDEAGVSLARLQWIKRFHTTTHILGFLGVVVVAIYLSLLTLAPKVVVSGDATLIRDTKEYSQTARDMTSNIGSRNKLSINRQKISADMQQRFPELSTVSVTTPLFSPFATIHVTLSQPALLLKSGSDAYVIDNSGRTLLNTRQSSTVLAEDKLLTVNDISNTAIEVGKPALTSEQVAFILELRHQSEAKQLTVESASLLGGGGELTVRYAGYPYYVKYNLNEDARKSFGTFIATKEYVEKANTKPSEYIDVRIAERAYVK